MSNTNIPKSEHSLGTKIGRQKEPALDLGSSSSEWELCPQRVFWKRVPVDSPWIPRLLGIVKRSLQATERSLEFWMAIRCTWRPNVSMWKSSHMGQRWSFGAIIQLTLSVYMIYIIYLFFPSAQLYIWYIFKKSHFDSPLLFFARPISSFTMLEPAECALPMGRKCQLRDEYLDIHVMSFAMKCDMKCGMKVNC